MQSGAYDINISVRITSDPIVLYTVNVAIECNQTWDTIAETIQVALREQTINGDETVEITIGERIRITSVAGGQYADRHFHSLSRYV